MTRITRLEVITDTGRDYVCWEEDNDITVSYQDDGRTLKVFVNTMKPKTGEERALEALDKFQNDWLLGKKCPETKLEIKNLNSVESIKAEIKVLQSKLEFYEELEKTKSSVEEAYKRVYGAYPPTTPSVSNFEDTRWSVFQAGYNASQKDYKVGEFQHLNEELLKSKEKEMIKKNLKTSLQELVNGDVRPIDDVVRETKNQQIKELVRESVKWCEEHPDESVEDYLRPKTPEQTEKSLKEAFVKAQQTEEWKETQRKIDAPKESWMNKSDEELIAILEKNPPDCLRFELSPSLEDRIYKWWETCFVHHPEWSMEECVEDLLDIIELYLPRFQSASGSQSLGVEDMVEGFNDCLKKIKSKLRNKKDT